MNEIKTIEQKFQEIGMPLSKELLTNKTSLDAILENIKSLESVPIDISTKNGIKQAKEIKTHANKFVKALKEFCEPLEAEGKAIADARSLISTTLVTGKNAVVTNILKPIEELEAQFSEIVKDKNVSSKSEADNKVRTEKYNALLVFEWHALKADADAIISAQLVFLENEAFGFEKQRLEAERLEFEKLEAERIAREHLAIERQKIEAERKILEAQKIEAEKEAILVKANAELEAKKKAQEILAEAKKEADSVNPVSNKNYANENYEIERQKAVHNEILNDLCFNCNLDKETAKKIIIAIAKGFIKNLKISYE
jgi:hypothetical protein